MQSEPTFPKRHAVWTMVLIVTAFAIAAITASCGSSNGENQSAKTVTVTTPAATPTTSTSAGRQRATSSHGSAGSGRKGQPRPAKARAHVMCDANIRIKAATTTCPFAENVFLGHWTNQNYRGSAATAYSPAAHQEFHVACTRRAGTVLCTAGDGAEVSFPKTAVDAYTLAQAKRYVASHDVSDNIFPWEQSGSPGSDDTTPPYTTPDETPSYSVPDTSSTPPGPNIPNYDNGRGDRVQCADGTFSQSGGIQGACSHHGGLG